MKYWTYLIVILMFFPFADFYSRHSDCKEEQDLNECVLRFYCVDVVEWEYQVHHFDELSNYEHYSDFYNLCKYYVINNELKIALAFKINSASRDIIPQLYGGTDLMIPWIYYFDLSNNDLIDTPNMMEMQKLRVLNLSHNNFTVAQLYNDRLPSLQYIDYSYNNINKLDVSGEHKFGIVSLNVSHNNLDSLPNNVFEKYSTINNLDLSYNHIELVQMQTFEGLNSLLTLNLSHNNLKYINSSFFRFSKLKVLNLCHNKIEVINTQDFIYLRSLKTLDLSFNLILTIDKYFFSNMPLLKELNITHNRIELIDKDLFLNNSDLISVDISSNNLHGLPKDLFKDKRMSSFSVVENKLEGSLVRGMFDGLTMISDLDLSKHLLSAIQDYAFFGLGNLKRLILCHNNIDLLTKKSFSGLFALFYLDLANNKITNLDFEKDNLMSLRYLSLEHNFLKTIGHEDYLHLNALNFLNLAYNNITKIEPETFKSLQDLIHFEISNNPLSGNLEKGTFDGFNSLPKIDISGSKLTSIANNSFTGMFHLKDLNVSHSLINSLEYNAFVNTSHIKSIDLSYNKLTVFSINPLCLLNLITLNISNNMLNFISENTFKGFYKLEIIDLAYNDIHIIHNEAFNDQTDLQHLALSHNAKMRFDITIVQRSHKLNKILLSGLDYPITFSNESSVPVKTVQLVDDGIKNINKLNLGALFMLENIDLKYNNISILNVNDFSDVKSLKTLDLSNNKISSIQPGAFQFNNNLTFLNISHNMLSELNYGIFNGLSNLRILDVSFNKLFDLKSERFYELQNLKVLVVDHNNIDSIDAQELNALAILSIGENPLPCELLINFYKTGTPFQLTAINNVTQNTSNINGIICNKKKMFSLNDTKNLQNNRVLYEIRDELVRIANENKFQTNSASTNENNSKYDMNEQLNKALQLNDQQLSHITNHTEILVKEKNITNALLQKMTKLLTAITKTTTVIPFTKDNATLDSILPYINKIKQELEDLIASEKENIMDDINSKLSSKNTNIDRTKSSTLANIQPKQEPMQSMNNKEQSKSVFTEVCVGAILFILVGYILYTVYKSRLFVRPRRTSSTRELESPNL